MNGAATKSPLGRAARAAAIGAALLLAGGPSTAAFASTSRLPAVHSATQGVLSPPQVRVDQVGYTESSPKVAFVMLARPVGTLRFAVEDSRGIAFSGTSDDDLGGWNSRYHAVYELTFTPLDRPGQYRLQVETGQPVVSPPFFIGSPASLYHQLVVNAVR